MYLTEKFDSTPEEEQKEPDEERQTEVTSDSDQENATGDDATVSQDPEIALTGSAVIMGRLRKRNGKPLEAFEGSLLNDNLRELANVLTDDRGVFRINGVDQNAMNLIRMSEDDDNLLIDIFLYDSKGNILANSVPLGHRMHRFLSRQTGKSFPALSILTERELVVMVKQGKSSMIGKVVDRETYLMGREGVRVELYTPRKALLRTAITDQEGKFLFTQLEQEDYIVKVDHIPDEDYVEIVIADDQNRPYALSTSDDEDNEGYFRFRKLPMQEIDMEEVEAEDESSFQHHYYTMLTEEEPGVPYELHSLEFATSSSTLPGEYDELDQLARELKDNPGIRIKIDGHTDSVGGEEGNKELSLQRAETVKAYLVKQGGSPSRITCEGIGSRKPIAENDTEHGRSINRRVEFSIEE